MGPPILHTLAHSAHSLRPLLGLVVTLTIRLLLMLFFYHDLHFFLSKTKNIFAVCLKKKHFTFVIVGLLYAITQAGEG